MKKLLSLTAMLVVALMASAAIPKGYYTALNGKSQAQLKAAVKEVVSPHTEVSSYSDLPKYFMKTDLYPESSRWWDMYSNIPLYSPSFSGLNREHSFPKSWWGGGTDTPAYVDLNHLYPSEARANQAKSNFPLGTVMTPTFDNGVTKVGYPVTGQGGGASKVFEPADEYKGDFARTYFYMVTTYSNLNWNSNYMWMLQQNSYPTLTRWAIDMLLDWSRHDPVSQKEIDRNEQVYLIQNNRNPFIDFPELCEYIWGDKMGQAFQVSDQGEPSGDPNLITPTQGMSLDLGQVAIGSTATSRLFFKGENCKGSFTITITGNDKSYFTSDTRTISASVVNAADGYWLVVKYTPAEIGQHVARLIVSDGGLTGSRGIELLGECLDVPTLNAVTATAPSDITDDSYVANWEAPQGTAIDYYIVTRTRYIGSTATSEELVAEGNSLEITDFAGSNRETYSVQSVRLGYRSPMSNVITVDHSGIEGVEMEAPMAVMSYPGTIRFVCGEPQRDCGVYDLSGRLVRLIPVVENNMEITLPAGVYFITTATHSTPLKAVAY